MSNVLITGFFAVLYTLALFAMFRTKWKDNGNIIALIMTVFVFINLEFFGNNATLVRPALAPGTIGFDVPGFFYQPPYIFIVYFLFIVGITISDKEKIKFSPAFVFWVALSTIQMALLVYLSWYINAQTIK